MGYGPDITFGETATALSENSPSYGAPKAIDDTNTAWTSEGTPSMPHWWQIEFASPKQVKKLRIQGSFNTDRSPVDFTFKASNSGSFSGEELDLVSDSGLSWTSAEWKEWEFSNEDPFTYYRIHITVKGGSSLIEIREIEMMESDELASLSDEIGIQDSTDGDTEERYQTDQIGFADVVHAAGGKTFATASDSIVLNDQISVNIEVELQPLADGFSLNDVIEASIWPGKISDAFSLSGTVQGAFEYPVALADGVGISDLIEGLNWTQWLRDNADLAIKRYFFTLTGLNDNKSDIEIPISAFQARQRTGYDTYLNVTIKGFDNTTDIADRPNGDLVLDLGYEINGVIQIREEILRVGFTKSNVYEGSRRRSIQLTGYRTHNFANQISRVENPNYKSTDDGRILYRFAHIDPYVNPGDTCRVANDEFTVDYISYNVARNFSQMEIRET